MAFLNTLDIGQWSPTLCIRAGVVYCEQIISPRSGTAGTEVRTCNSRIHGDYNRQEKFECGYFDFENYSPRTPQATPVVKKIFSIDGVYSGEQHGTNMTMPMVSNFWKNIGPSNSIANTVTSSYINMKNVIVTSGIPLINDTTIDIYIPSSGNLLNGPNGHAGVFGDPDTGDITIYGRFKLKRGSDNDVMDLAVFGDAESPDFGNGFRVTSSNRLQVFQHSSPGIYDVLEGTANITAAQSFYNFLFIDGVTGGLSRLYESFDEGPLRLSSIGTNTQLKSWYSGVTLTTNSSTETNIVAWSDLGISNRYWNQSNIDEFNRARLYPGYFIADNPYSQLPTPSGSDINYLNFHFPAYTSGNRGLVDSSNYSSAEYYVSLNSGISPSLYEFDRLDTNPTAVSIDLWAKSQGTNPSGHIQTKLVFFDNSYWSGYPIHLPHNQLTLVKASGQLYDYAGNPKDLSEMDWFDIGFPKLGLGAWYSNIHTDYSGDINIYSARVYFDGFCIPPSTGNSLTLYVSGQEIRTASLDLYLQNSTCFDSMDLYIEGCGIADSGCPLFIAGGFAFKSMPLYIGGKDSEDESCTLYMDGGLQKAAMPLFIYSQPPDQMSGNIPLCMWATEHSGSSGGMTLFIGENAPSGITQAGMNLYTMGPQSLQVTGAMNLFLKRDVYTHSDSITLYCHNGFTQTEGELTLFMKAPSGTLGAIPHSGAMNLFIARSSEAIDGGISLYTSGPQTVDSGVSLFMEGGTPYFSSIPLYTDGIGVNTEKLRLYINGF